MKRIPFVILLGSLCALSTAFATTYVRVEKDGTKTYSDRPIPGGQPIELEPAQTYSAPAEQPRQSDLPREQQLLEHMDDFRYASCAVTPKNDETLTNPETVSVAVALAPNLRAGDIVDLRVDGAPAGAPNAMSAALANVPRGTHTVSVQVKDRYGRTLCNATASFHVQRPSLNSPARRR